MRTAIDEMKTRLRAPYRNGAPAPPWVTALIDSLVPKRLYDESLQVPVIEGQMLMILGWCAAGEPVYRAEQILTVTKLWIGSTPLDVASTFVDDARASKGGRPRLQWKDGPPVKERHVQAVRLDASWEALDQRRAEEKAAAT